MVWLLLLASLAPQRWPIETLSVEGNRNYTAAQILKVAGLTIGQMAGKEEFEAAHDRLVATGAFETVGYRFGPGPQKKGYAASFQVVEVEPVYPVRFEELGVPDAEILAWLRAREPMFAERIPGTAPVLGRYAGEIEKLLASRKKEEKVVGRVTATGPDQFEVLFRPARAIPTVAQVTFRGNQVLPSPALQEAIAGVAIGVPYREERFRQILDASVRPLYEARGRIRLAFPKIATEPSKSLNGLDVTVTVQEGDSYDLGKVEFGNTAPLKTADLIKIGDFKSGDLANFAVINQGLDRIRDAYHRVGYLQVETVAERKIDDGRKTVDLTVRVTPGPRFVMGKLEIAGLDMHGEAAVRKMWTLKEGAPFRGGYPEYFLQQVRERGVFDNLKDTRAAVKINDADHTVDVTLTFK
ncbi:MAG: POTRA domain-containing protein [Bryobacteraceae bacterium]